jgi:hypothetical protein
MNEQLAQLALEAGAPEEMMTEMWFSVFCIKFADAIVTLMEQEIAE